MYHKLKFLNQLDNIDSIAFIVVYNQIHIDCFSCFAVTSNDEVVGGAIYWKFLLRAADGGVR